MTRRNFLSRLRSAAISIALAPVLCRAAQEMAPVLSEPNWFKHNPLHLEMVMRRFMEESGNLSEALQQILSSPSPWLALAPDNLTSRPNPPS